MNKQPDESFEFPRQLLNSIAECSKDGCFLLITKDDHGNFTPIFSASNESDAHGLLGWTQKYLNVIDNIEFSNMVDMFELGEENGEGDE